MDDKSPTHDLSAHVKRLGDHTTHVVKIEKQAPKQNTQLDVLLFVPGIGHSGDCEKHQNSDHHQRDDDIGNLYDPKVMLNHGLMGGHIGFRELGQRFVYQTVHLAG